MRHFGQRLGLSYESFGFVLVNERFQAGILNGPQCRFLLKIQRQLLLAYADAFAVVRSWKRQELFVFDRWAWCQSEDPKSGHQQVARLATRLRMVWLSRLHLELGPGKVASCGQLFKYSLK